MADKKEQVSPEEKLLKVIQGGTGKGGEKAEAKGAPAAAADPSPAAKPKLRVAPAEPKKETQPAAVAASEDAGLIGVASVPVAAHRPAIQIGLPVVNRGLAALVAVLLGVASFEVWSNVMAMQSPISAPSDVLAAMASETEVELPPLAELLKAFEAKAILRDLEQVAGPPTSTNDTRAVAQKGALRTVQEIFDLIGISGVGSGGGSAEAILVDTKLKRMHFLRVGQSLQVEGRDVSVVEIRSDAVVLSDGQSSVTIK